VLFFIFLLVNFDNFDHFQLCDGGIGIDNSLLKTLAKFVNLMYKTKREVPPTLSPGGSMKKEAIDLAVTVVLLVFTVALVSLILAFWAWASGPRSKKPTEEQPPMQNWGHGEFPETPDLRGSAKTGWEKVGTRTLLS